VQRRELAAALDGGAHLLVHQHRLAEVLAAVDHAVAHPGDLVDRGDHAVARVHERGQHQVDRGLVVGISATSRISLASPRL